MNHLIKILLIFSIVGSNCFADTNAISISKGTPAPYDGVLLSKEGAKLIYGTLADYDRIKLLNQSLETSVKLYQDNETIYLKEVTEVRDQNLTLQTAVEAAQSNSLWIKALWFVGGMVVMGSAVYLADHR